MTKKKSPAIPRLENLELRTNPSSFSEPISISSLNGVLDVTLRAHESTQIIEIKNPLDVFAPGTPSEVDGFLTYAWTVNTGLASNSQTSGDFFPGPTLKVNPGETLRIRLQNDLAEPTNFHTHGLEISPLGNSDNIILNIGPGQQNVFEYQIPLDEPQGTYWYHSHEHAFSKNQVYRGMAGFLIVGAANSAIDQVSDLPTRLMVLQNQTIDLNAATGRYELLPFNMNDLTHSQFTVNGQYMPELQMTALHEVWALLQVDPVDLTRTYVPPAGEPLNLYNFDDPANQPIYFVAQDGHAFPQTVLKPTRTALAPGKRIAEIHSAPPEGIDRIFALTSLVPALNPPGGVNPTITQPLLTMHGFGAGGNPDVWANVNLTSPFEFTSLAPEPVDVYRTVDFKSIISTDPAIPSQFLINGELFPNPPIFRPRLDTVEQWTLTNSDSPTLPHPLHNHLAHFQGQYAPGSLFTPPHPYDQDVWYIEQSEAPGPLLPTQIKTVFEKFTGLTVFHCHNLGHEDLGMMALMDVIPNIPIYATGASAGGGPVVTVYNSLLNNSLNNQALASFYAFEPDFTGGVEVAVADVNNDSISDVIVGAGPGGGPRVRVFDGATNFSTTLFDFFAFAADFRGGVSVAGGDFNADGYADIAVGAQAGGGPNVRTFDGRTGAMISDFFAYSPEFPGGVTLAAGVMDASGLPSLVTGAGPGGGSHVKIWENSLINFIDDAPIFPGTNQVHFGMRGEFFAYETSYNGGVQVALGYNGGMSQGGFQRILTGTMSQGPRVTVWEAGMSHSMNGEESMLDLEMVNTFFAFDPSVTSGVRVGTVANSTGSDLIVASGAGGSTQVKRFSFGPGAEEPTLIEELDPFSAGFSGGAVVGGTL